MRATNITYPEIDPHSLITVTTEGLQLLLGCGRDSAAHIGELAEARVQIGRRVLWNVNKIKEYIDLISY